MIYSRMIYSIMTCSITGLCAGFSKGGFYIIIIVSVKRVTQLVRVRAISDWRILKYTQLSALIML